MARPSERDRYKYGICTNRDKNGEGTPCPKCESKEVQKVRAGQDFVCEECKEPLRMVPPPWRYCRSCCNPWWCGHWNRP